MIVVLQTQGSQAKFHELDIYIYYIFIYYYYYIEHSPYYIALGSTQTHKGI